MTYKNEIIDSLLKSSDIVNIISNYVNLKRKGSNFVGLCPFHDDTNPSFIVSSKKNIYKCFSCNEGGNVINFIKKIENVSYLKSIEIIAEKSNFILPKIQINNNEEKYIFFEINKQALDLFKKSLFSKENIEALNFLNSKGITNEMINFFNIGFAPNNKDFLFKIMTNFENILFNKKKEEIWSEKNLIDNGLVFLDSQNNYSDFFRNRIIFPIFDLEKNIIGFSGRTIDNNEKIKYLNSKSSKYFKKDSIFFNIDKIDKNHKKIYITEGFMDVISFYKNNYKNVIALMGTNFSNNHLNILNSYSFDSIIIGMDNDEAGQKANILIGDKIIKNSKNIRNIMVINKYNSKFKDFGDLIFLDKNKFDEIVHSYISYIEYRINYYFSLINPNLFDEKISFLENLEDYIAKNSNINLIDYYSKILSEKTNMSSYDIKNSISSKLNLQKNIDSFEDLIYPKINYENISYESFHKDKIFNLEIKLIELMLVEPRITEIFKSKLNYLEISKSDIQYNNLKNIILITYELNNNYSFKDIVKRMHNSEISKNFILKMEKNITIIIDNLNKKLYSSSDLIDQGNKIIDDLLKMNF